MDAEHATKATSAFGTEPIPATLRHFVQGISVVAVSWYGARRLAGRYEHGQHP